MNIKHFFKRVNSDNPLYAMPGRMAQAVVHPCVIDNQPHVVYPRGLAEAQPALFAQLSRYYTQQGYRLKEDQRSKSSSNRYRNQRRKWMPVLLFTASLLVENVAFAEPEQDSEENTPSLSPPSITLNLVAAKKPVAGFFDPAAQATKVTELKSPQAKAIFKILQSRYQPQPGDPAYIENDLREIANYYSEFPQPVALLEQLKDKNWLLIYDRDNWVTTGSGNMIQVEKAVVHFNTRSAAQLRLNNGCKSNPVCVASPADALLHELLHVKSMLVNSGEFLSQGGMNNVIYPYQHEYAVIDKERQLYASMSRHDHLKRPQRREHTGRLVRSRCATCID